MNRSLVVRIVRVVWVESSIDHPCWERAHPLLKMKGTALQERERERVCMLLSLVAHAVGYKMMVGAHNIVDVRRMWEVFTVFL